MLELRKATNAYIGANLDPSHMWWQGIDPVAAIKILGREDALHHFHAKDTYIDPEYLNMHAISICGRSEAFGLGHSMDEWANMMSALRTIEEGFQTAVRNLQGVIIKEQPTDMWWA